jgi:sentrin-specific protease 8
MQTELTSRPKPKKLAPDEAYLSYYDVRLYGHDVECIRGDWLTDNAITFWQEYLERERLSELPRTNIVLLRPSMSFLLMCTHDPLTLREALPDFRGTTHIFLPINNAKNVEVPEVGSHWSLLVASAIDGVAFHYDSLGRDNEDEARVAAAKLAQLLGRALRFTQMRDVPRQGNGSDCGVFVCMFMERLLFDRLLVADAGQKISVSLDGSPFNARKYRRRMLDIIEELRREGKRRRSRSPSPFRSRSPPRIGDEQDPR